MRQPFELVRRKLKDYQEHEPWKTDHDDAMECYAIEDAIATGIFIFERISRLDEAVHAYFFKNADKDGGAFEESIAQMTECYREWKNAFEPLLAEIRKAEDKDYHLQGAEDFKKRSKQVNGALSDDQDYFSGRQLNDMEKQALSEHSAGKTFDFGGLAD